MKNFRRNFLEDFFIKNFDNSKILQKNSIGSLTKQCIKTIKRRKTTLPEEEKKIETDAARIASIFFSLCRRRRCRRSSFSFSNDCEMSHRRLSKEKREEKKLQKNCHFSEISLRNLSDRLSMALTPVVKLVDLYVIESIDGKHRFEFALSFSFSFYRLDIAMKSLIMALVFNGCTTTKKQQWENQRLFLYDRFTIQTQHVFQHTFGDH